MKQMFISLYGSMEKIAQRLNAHTEKGVSVTVLSLHPRGEKLGMYEGMAEVRREEE